MVLRLCIIRCGPDGREPLTEELGLRAKDRWWFGVDEIVRPAASNTCADQLWTSPPEAGPQLPPSCLCPLWAVLAVSLSFLNFLGLGVRVGVQGWESGEP